MQFIMPNKFHTQGRKLPTHKFVFIEIKYLHQLATVIASCHFTSRHLSIVYCN